MKFIACIALIINFLGAIEEIREFGHEVTIFGIVGLIYNWILILFFLKFLFF